MVNKEDFLYTVKTVFIELNKEEKNNNEDNLNNNNGINEIKYHLVRSIIVYKETKRAMIALEEFFKNNNLTNFWIGYGPKTDEIHEGDIMCYFGKESDKKKFKKIFEDYGFVLRDTQNGFWMTGVKKCTNKTK